MHTSNRDRCLGQQIKAAGTGTLRFARHFWPAMLTLGVVLWLTLAPDPTPDLETSWFLGKYADKVVHFIMMGGLTGAWIFDLKRNASQSPGRLGVHVYVILGLAMAVFCALDEWVQGAMGLGRSADFADYVADMAGVATGLLTAPCVCDWVIRRMHSKKRSDNLAE